MAADFMVSGIFESSIILDFTADFKFLEAF